jgi:hypothetical protein
VLVPPHFQETKKTKKCRRNSIMAIAINEKENIHLQSANKEINLKSIEEMKKRPHQIHIELKSIDL